MLARWEQAAATNPRLFNGEILRFMSFDAERRVVRAAWDTYQRYAMQDRPPACASMDRAADAVVHLAVTGVVMVGDSVVLGERGASTFVYPGMWEHAPAGGLESADFYPQLLREFSEELGAPDLGDAAARDTILHPPGADDVLGVVFDPNAPSLDIVVRLQLRDGAESLLAGGSWEYGRTRVVPTGALGSFVEEVGDTQIIPPALALWRALRWT